MFGFDFKRHPHPDKTGFDTLTVSLVLVSFYLLICISLGGKCWGLGWILVKILKIILRPGIYWSDSVSAISDSHNQSFVAVLKDYHNQTFVAWLSQFWKRQLFSWWTLNPKLACIIQNKYILGILGQKLPIGVWMVRVISNKRILFKS